MNRRRFGAMALVCLLMAAALPRRADSTPISMSLAGTGATATTRAALPACSAALQGFEFWVTDLASEGSCAAGGGSAKAYCHCDGSAYQVRAAGAWLPLAGGSMAGPIAMGASKITGLGAPTAGSTDAARHADLQFACGFASSSCAKVDDSNVDGDIAPELQAAINSVLWPGGTLTTATDVYLAAPKQGTYNLASRIIICGDTSPPSGSTAPDCTGTQQLPRIHFLGAWSAATLFCTMSNTDVVNHLTPCIQVGDAWGDGGDFTKDVPLAFDSPLTVRTTVDYAGSLPYEASLGVWCNGCAGELWLDLDHTSMTLPGPLAVIAGGKLASRIRAGGLVAGQSSTVVMDGRQTGSSIELLGADMTLEIGSFPSMAGFGRWSPYDGCSYNGFVGECDDLHVLPSTRIVGGYASDGQIVVASSENITIEGSYRSTLSGQPKPIVEALVGASNAAIRRLTFRGTCVSAIGNSNSCIRIMGSYVPSWTPTIVLDGPVVSAVAVSDKDKAGAGCNHGISGPGPTRLIVGPGASMRNTGGGNPHYLNLKNPYSLEQEACNATGVGAETLVLRAPAQTLGASPPYCLDLKDGTWRSCSDERTRLRRAQVPTLWMQRTDVRLYGSVGASTTCNLRVVKDGTTINGADPPLPTDYHPNGYSFRLGGDGLKAAGDAIGFNNTGTLPSSSYWQVQVDDDYATAGGEEACLATVASGYSTSNGSTTTLNDSTKSWATNEHSAAGRRVVFDAGQGSRTIKTIASNTATQISWSGALAAATYGADNSARTKYRIVAGSGACTCASAALPELDVTLHMFPVNE